MTSPTGIDLVTLRDIAELFGVDVGRVNMWRSRGQLPPPALNPDGHKPLFDRATIEAWGRRTGRMKGQPGRVYDANGYDVTDNYQPKKGA